MSGQSLRKDRYLRRETAGASKCDLRLEHERAPRLKAARHTETRIRPDPRSRRSHGGRIETGKELAIRQTEGVSIRCSGIERDGVLIEQVDNVHADEQTRALPQTNALLHEHVRLGVERCPAQVPAAVRKEVNPVRALFNDCRLPSTDFVGA